MDDIGQAIHNIVHDSNFLLTFETEKKHTFNENLTESLKRKIMVKP